MTYSAIMTHVQPGPETAPRLACALALAERFGAKLIGLGVEMIPPLAFDNGFYSVDAEWVIVEEGFTLAREHEVESLFAIGNGYAGSRGSLGEGYALSAPATFVAGVYDAVLRLTRFRGARQAFNGGFSDAQDESALFT